MATQNNSPYVDLKTNRVNVSGILGDTVRYDFTKLQSPIRVVFLMQNFQFTWVKFAFFKIFFTIVVNAPQSVAEVSVVCCRLLTTAKTSISCSPEIDYSPDPFSLVTQLVP